ncbi:S8 family peptidase [Hymenobacter sp. BT770]|uniref:S8 family peptidase n=1 Tax=Hymenobacter sp. BT770 TaxID=2886942 RepID=UPI001D113CD9|nr:S8 family peptidase [Hymenobacter sp. BT770]MCC3153092.1 S8 family peptidase [Hymenobacter sp. BT770]MDO3415434.1 S8 family peptidase [Hymenobacter sp. BT770]
MTLSLSRVSMPVLLAVTLLSSCARRPQASSPVASTAVSAPAAAPEVLTAPETKPAPAPTPAPIGDLSSAQWYLKDPTLDKVPGVGATRVYNEILKTLTPQPVVVAVIDSGIDTAHVDLKTVLWTNPKEIPNNGIDDDKNGYVDDVHGWNFLGGPDGRNVNAETLEMTRIVAAGRKRFKGKTAATVKPTERTDFALYTKAEKAYSARLKEETERSEQVESMTGPLTMMVDNLKQALGVTTLDTTALRTIKTDDPNLRRATAGMLEMMRQTGAADTDALLKELSEGAKQERSMLDNSLNLKFNPRADIVKDNPNDVTERYYGNNDLHGPDPMHGTHVSGIIAAVRDNQLGVQGIAPNPVRIMVVRAVPDGDERDKDVANAIRYAVDNGAQIINMSFGKEFSPQRQAVEAAFKYAASKNVLLVHAAGNENANLDVTSNYPASFYINKTTVPNLLTVGASGPRDNAQLPANFSNYSKRAVDVFAPGMSIFSTLPGSKFGNESGTSMASPVTAGVAAVLKSYFPKLTAADLKRIIMQSARVHHTKVQVPGTDKMVDFSTLSVTGGVVDLYEAVRLAQKASL